MSQVVGKWCRGVQGSREVGRSVTGSGEVGRGVTGSG